MKKVALIGDSIRLGYQAKVAALREQREAQYELLKDAVYARRGWSPNGVPTLETIKKLKINFPEVVELAKNAK